MLVRNFFPTSGYLTATAIFYHIFVFSLPALTLFNDFRNNIHKIFSFSLCYLCAKYICGSLVRRTSCFSASSECILYILLPCFRTIKMDCLYNEQGNFLMPRKIVLLFPHFWWRKKNLKQMKLRYMKIKFIFSIAI